MSEIPPTVSFSLKFFKLLFTDFQYFLQNIRLRCLILNMVADEAA